MLNRASSQSQEFHTSLGLSLCALFLLTMFVPQFLQAEDIAQVKKGVVKITAQVEGKQRVGSGVIVKVDDDHVYLVTASHVIEGDPQPNVFFYAAPHRSFRARVLGLEGDDPAGLAALLVEGKIPSDLVALHLDQATKVSGGEPITLIGFPRAEGAMWTVTTGTLSGRKGTALSFSGTADEGNSGGPVLFQGSVVGIVTQVGAKFNAAVPAVVARFALEGWGVTLAAEIPKSQREEAKGSTSGQTGSIDYSSFEQVKRAAERGDPKAMDVLGDMYAKGTGVRENYAEAAKWYRRSADAGYPEAFNGMGLLSLMKALGLASNDESAIRLAHDESRKAEFGRVFLYPQEYPVRNQVELNEAIRWLRKGAEEGHSSESQLVLALLTGAGIGIEKDPVQAAKWMRLAATKEPAAQAFMGLYYLAGQGVEKDPVEAARRLREAAEKEVPIAYATLGIMYAEGLGVVKDYAEARKWLRKGVQHGDPEAKGYLGMLHYLGWGGPKDLAQAYRLAKETAEQGEPTGQYLLGIMFFSGEGVPQDAGESLKWLQASARQGNHHAQQFLQERGQSW
jgi:TPR repeat protein